MAEGRRRICNLDNDSFETLIHLYRPYLVKNLKVYDLVISSPCLIPGQAEVKVMRLERNNQTEEAARVFLGAFLESEDPAKWSSLKHALDKPEHALIVDILERGVTEELKIHEELQNVVDLFRKDIVEALDPFLMCQYLQQAGLLSLAEAQKVQACQRQDGDNMANFLLMSYVPRNKDWYLQFMKIIWAQGLVELVRLIDPEMFDKLSAPNRMPERPHESVGARSVQLSFEESGETAVKLLTAPTKEPGMKLAGTTLHNFPEQDYTNILDSSRRKSWNLNGEKLEDVNKNKIMNVKPSEEIKKLNIPVTAMRELSIDSNESQEPYSMDNNISELSPHPGMHLYNQNSGLNQLSSKHSNKVTSVAGRIGVHVPGGNSQIIMDPFKYAVGSGENALTVTSNASAKSLQQDIASETARRLRMAGTPPRNSFEETVNETFLKRPNTVSPIHARPNDLQRASNTSQHYDDDEIPAEVVEQLLSIPDTDVPPPGRTLSRTEQPARSESRHQLQQSPQNKPQYTARSRPDNRPKSHSKPEPSKSTTTREPIKGGMSDGYTVDVACLADDDMAIHGAMLHNAAAGNQKADQPGVCRQS